MVEKWKIEFMASARPQTSLRNCDCCGVIRDGDCVCLGVSGKEALQATARSPAQLSGKWEPQWGFGLEVGGEAPSVDHSLRLPWWREGLKRGPALR